MPENKEFSRRQFLKMASGVAIGVGFGGALPKLINLGDGVIAIPASQGYLLVDTKKCSGCISCMLACSLVHEGKENLSFSRIQIMQNSFVGFPNDIVQAQCKQCTYPACVEACPTNALKADPQNGYVRLVESKKCIGCQQCIEACPQQPARVQWNHEEKHSQKCDLCANTPYWSEEGGPDGKQACVQVCPLKAIKFTKEIPTQVGDLGYKVNLRNTNWKKLGFPIN